MDDGKIDVPLPSIYLFFVVATVYIHEAYARTMGRDVWQVNTLSDAQVIQLMKIRGVKTKTQTWDAYNTTLWLTFLLTALRILSLLHE